MIPKLNSVFLINAGFIDMETNDTDLKMYDDIQRYVKRHFTHESDHVHTLLCDVIGRVMVEYADCMTIRLMDDRQWRCGAVLPQYRHDIAGAYIIIRHEYEGEDAAVGIAYYQAATVYLKNITVCTDIAGGLAVYMHVEGTFHTLQSDKIRITSDTSDDEMEAIVALMCRNAYVIDSCARHLGTNPKFEGTR